MYTYVSVCIYTEEQQLARQCKVALYIESFYKNQTSGISEKETCRSLGIPTVKKMRSLLEKGVHRCTYIHTYTCMYVYISSIYICVCIHKGKEAQEQLVQYNMKLVIHIAKYYRFR